ELVSEVAQRFFGNSQSANLPQPFRPLSLTPVIYPLLPRSPNRPDHPPFVSRWARPTLTSGPRAGAPSGRRAGAAGPPAAGPRAAGRTAAEPSRPRGRARPACRTPVAPRPVRPARTTPGRPRGPPEPDA